MIQYDNNGRMLYNPDYHENHRKPWTISDLMYLCSMDGGMSLKHLSMALGRTETTISEKLDTLKDKRLEDYNYYRKLGKAI